jgi:hypothetical protein
MPARYAAAPQAFKEDDLSGLTQLPVKAESEVRTQSYLSSFLANAISELRKVRFLPRSLGMKHTLTDENL